MNHRANLRTRRLLLAALVTVSLLAGCGQRGPLYLPEEPAEEEAENR